MTAYMKRLASGALVLALCALPMCFGTAFGDAPAKKEPKPQVEVVFCLDTTGSMGGLIDAAKQKIWTIANQIASGKPTPRLKIGLVAYRDRSGRTIANDDDDAWLRPAFRQIHRVMKDSTLCVSFYGWHKVDAFFAAWRAAGLTLRCAKIARRIGSTAYVSGSRRLRIPSQRGRLATENSAPEMKNIGMITICISAMNDCIWLILAANITPKAVIANASSSVSASSSRIRPNS